MRNDAKNLEAISKAIDQHNRNCDKPAIEVRMSPFEVERLGWETIRGLPIVADSTLPTGRFRVVCAGEKTGDEAEDPITEAVSRERELLTTV